MEKIVGTLKEIARALHSIARELKAIRQLMAGTPEGSENRPDSIEGSESE